MCIRDRDITDYTLWTDISSNLGDIASVWAAEDNYDQFKTYLRSIFANIAKKLGWDAKEGEGPLTQSLRAVVLSKMGGAGDEDTIKEAKTRFAAYLKDESSLPADLRGAVYNMVVANGTEEDWEQVKQIYLKAELHEEKIRALRALGLSKDEALIKKTLEFGLSTDVRNQDVFYVLFSTAATVKGRQITWDHVKDNFALFTERFGSGAFLLGRIISLTISKFTSEKHAADAEAFFKANPCDLGKRSIDQGLESIRSRASWLARDREDVAKFLSAQK
eukprot:TRINITY_DN3767_c0_g1_i2.p1 TRINITY_DN3767_c0_g1~~TRINITY_DN3767_c0_g1_i2.p1  ORF type:complete len:276 (-),score=68.30 TRINITY_DN3767_c0_g1_i2:39-866(-)